MESHSPHPDPDHTVAGMSQLQVIPEALAQAAEVLRSEHDRVGRAAQAAGAAAEGIATALPGSSTAVAVGSTATEVVAAVRVAAAELATLAVALSAAASHYLAVEQQAAEGLERAGRRRS